MKYQKRIFLLLILILIVIFKCENSQKSNKKQSNPKFELKKPISSIDIKYEVFNISSDKDTLITTSIGSIIEIPKNAFLNSKGEIVKSAIELKFRTFYNPLDIYISGIPMTYSMDGVEKNLESAGMFEIKAHNNENELFVNPESKINVTLLSFNESNQYNTYDFDEDKGIWKKTGKDSISIINKSEDYEKIINIPSPPRKAGRFAFEIKDELYKNTELSKYENVWFTPIDGKPCGFDAKDVKFKDLGGGKYEVTFIPWIEVKGLKTKCICYLSFKNGMDYDKAMQIYQKKYSKLIAEQKKIKDEIDKEWLDYYKKLKEYNVFYAREEIKKLKGSKKILRTLEVNNFGFVNIDKPMDYPKGGTITPSYEDQSGNYLILNDVVLVEKNKNALYRYNGDIKFNPEAENLLWGLTNDGKLAYFKDEDFKRLDKKVGKKVLTMKIHPKPLVDYDEIYNILFSN